MLDKIKGYIKGELELHPNTVRAMQRRGWLAEDGIKVTEEGLNASGLPTVTTYWLLLGSDVTIGKHLLQKGMRFPLTWANREHKDRRNWYYVVELPYKLKNGRFMTLTLNYSPKHIIEQRKLPVDKIKEGVLQLESRDE